jgi:hypothetical protein
MTDPPRRRSNWKLALFLAAAVLPPVVLVLGPFKQRFFPRDPDALPAIARVADVVAPTDRGELARLLGPKLTESGLADALASRFAERRYAEAEQALERVPIGEASPGVRWLHGVAALLDRRPAVALAGLEDAAKASDPALAREARFALAQTLLLLGRADAARPELEQLAQREGPHRAAAQQQLAALDSLLRRS